MPLSVPFGAGFFEKRMTPRRNLAWAALTHSCLDRFVPFCLPADFGASPPLSLLPLAPGLGAVA